MLVLADAKLLIVAMKAVERVTADTRFHTPDLGGKAKTADVTTGVIDAIHGGAPNSKSS
jgi:isocitrate/isopropylmalate dehydrogenase